MIEPPDGMVFAGLDLAQPRLMGVVNVTADSFSDGGAFADPVAAIAHGHKLAKDGADIIDIGGESTRPGAEPTDPTIERKRVVPVVAALAREGYLVSIDTRHADVAAAAIDAGARIVNDVTGLGAPAMRALVARSEASAVIMHMQGEPPTMQDDPRYGDPVAEIAGFFDRRLATCQADGIDARKLCLDPGIGFGKTVVHNLALLAGLAAFRRFGRAVLVGASRKGFIAKLSRNEPPLERLPGSLAAGIAALDRGARILRVHDVAASAQALAIWRAIREAGR